MIEQNTENNIEKLNDPFLTVAEFEHLVRELYPNDPVGRTIVRNVLEERGIKYDANLDHADIPVVDNENKTRIRTISLKPEDFGREIE